MLNGFILIRGFLRQSHVNDGVTVHLIKEHVSKTFHYKIKVWCSRNSSVCGWCINSFLPERAHVCHLHFVSSLTADSVHVCVKERQRGFSQDIQTWGDKFEIWTQGESGCFSAMWHVCPHDHMLWLWQYNQPCVSFSWFKSRKPLDKEEHLYLESIYEHKGTNSK